jgi:ankyrin repeat protein
LKENPQTSKYPIHYAVESEDVENLRALLKARDLDLNAFYEERTPVFLLIERMNEENFDRVFDCFRLLITYGADLGIVNQEDETVIDVLMKLDLNEDKKRYVAAIYCQFTNCLMPF